MVVIVVVGVGVSVVVVVLVKMVFHSFQNFWEVTHGGLAPPAPPTTIPRPTSVQPVIKDKSSITLQDELMVFINHLGMM